MSTDIEDPFAVIYPVSSAFAKRIYDEKRSVFVKYSNNENLSPRLKACKKLVIYESNTGRKVTGECDISAICSMEPSKVISKYEKELFINEAELRSYSSGREDKKMMVFKLTNVKKYSIPKILDHQITIAGEYMSRDEYNHLVSSINF